jgi:hypothetical protein
MGNIIKKSEYLEKYGFEIPFTDKELSLVDRDLQFYKGKTDKIEREGIVTDLKFGDSTFIKNGKKYLSVQFAIGDWWSREFPTEILAPPIYSEHTDSLVKLSMSIINDTY